jgi:crotonobetainyl-CoA:carnitine CoA-transferase CaiB-like acyl-CoA transferase
VTKVRATALLALLAATLAAGWQARGWYEDANRLTAERATQRTIDAALARESQIAASVEARLAELTASERVIERGIIREIERPIYRRVCLEPDAVRLLNDAAAGRAPDPAEPAEPLPGRTAPAD